MDSCTVLEATLGAIPEQVNQNDNAFSLPGGISSAEAVNSKDMNFWTAQSPTHNESGFFLQPKRCEVRVCGRFLYFLDNKTADFMPPN